MKNTYHYTESGLRNIWLANGYSVTVNGNWRVTFSFEGEDAEIVDYQDYH